MAQYGNTEGIIGGGPLGDLFVPDTTQRFPLGMVVDAVDPYFGWGRFVYLKSGQAESPGRLVMISDQTFVTADIPNTANTGYPIAVCRQVMAGASYYGWYQIEGVTPVQTANSVAQGTATGIAAAGKAGTLAAGKQVLGCRVLQASTFTLTKTGTTVNGSPVIQLTDVNGLFVGLTPSGTGVGAGTISVIDPNGRTITSTANSTANGTVTVTFTYTGFLLCSIQNAHVQGAIT